MNCSIFIANQKQKRNKDFKLIATVDQYTGGLVLLFTEDKTQVSFLKNETLSGLLSRPAVGETYRCWLCLMALAQTVSSSIKQGV